MEEYGTNIDRALADMGNDREIFAEVAETFLKDSPAKIREMKLNLSEKENNKIKENAHTIKSSARICGLYRLGEIAEIIEEKGIENDTLKKIESIEKIIEESENFFRDKGLI